MSQNVARLKELLFDRENATLAELQTRIDQVAANAGDKQRALEAALAEEATSRIQLAQQLETVLGRAGTEEGFRSSVAKVLDGALREAEIGRHEQLSRAIAPLMIKTIKVELRNSQDEMVEALYPITGRLVKAYIASAMKDLVDQINRRLSGGSNPLVLRLRGLLIGRSAAEVALAEAQRLEVAELFLVRRGTGELVEHWPPGPGGVQKSNSDIHLSGVLTAINDFAAEALKDDGGNLRAFELDDFQMYLRGSSAYLLAAKCRGIAPPGVESILDDEFLQLIERNGAQLADRTVSPSPMLASLADDLSNRLAEQRDAAQAGSTASLRPLKILAAIVLLPLLAWWGWSLYTRFETNQVREQAAKVVESMPQLAGYPLATEVAQRGVALTISGLVPNPSARSELLRRLREQLPATKVDDKLTALPNMAAELEPQVSDVRRGLAGVEGEAARGIVRRAVRRSIVRLDQASAQLDAMQGMVQRPVERSAILAVAGQVDKLATELRETQARLASGSPDLVEMATLTTPLHEAAGKLRTISAQLSATNVSSTTAAKSGHASGAPSDVLEGAEELSLAAEQLFTVVVAAGQAASVRPASPPPLPPVVIPAPAPSPRERLAQWVRSNAIFFGDGADFRSADVAHEKLDQLAKLINDANVLVRVVGFTDERGGQSRNAPLSQQRAQIVADALAERGVPRRLLVAIGRAQGMDISTATGSQSPNRRVEFELGFEGEVADTP